MTVDELYDALRGVIVLGPHYRGTCEVLIEVNGTRMTVTGLTVEGRLVRLSIGPFAAPVAEPQRKDTPHDND